MYRFIVLRSYIALGYVATIFMVYDIVAQYTS